MAWQRKECSRWPGRANPAGWWETGRNALPSQLPTLITFESQATKDAEARVAARAGRQTVLTRKRPPHYLAIIDEAVVRRPFGRGGYPIYGPFAWLQFSKAPAIVRLEHKQASGFLDQPEDTGPFQPLTDTLKAVALEPADTGEFLADAAAEYDKR